MKTISLKLYDFSELSAAAQKRAINDVRNYAAEVECECLNDDFRVTLQGICYALGIEVRDYNVGGGQSSFFRFDVDGELNDEDPALFLRWINSALSRIGKNKVYSINGKRRASKIMKTFEDWPFSGCWLDEKPEKVFRRYAEYIKAGRTIHDFCEDLLMALADGYNYALEYAYSDEAIGDFIEAQEYTFTENGERFACVV